jgi:hypothetical protein
MVPFRSLTTKGIPFHPPVSSRLVKKAHMLWCSLEYRVSVFRNIIPDSIISFSLRTLLSKS